MLTHLTIDERVRVRVRADYAGYDRATQAGLRGHLVRCFQALILTLTLTLTLTWLDGGGDWYMVVRAVEATAADDENDRGGDGGGDEGGDDRSDSGGEEGGDGGGEAGRRWRRWLW